MSDVLVSMPDEVYNRLQRMAQASAQSIESVVVSQLTASLPVNDLPPDEADELAALRHLSDDALWTIAREQMPESVQTHMANLMTRNTQGELTAAEHEELEALASRSDRLMMRKAEAAALLTQRGHTFTQKNFTPADE
jgi:hypothetical protein